MRAILVLALALAACGTPAATLGRPSPSASGSAAATSPVPTPSPSPSATPRPNPTTGPGTYTSIALGYRVELPAGWRRSACQSTRGITQPPATETYTAASVDEESGSDMGSAQDVALVHVEEAAPGQTALQWLQAGKLGQSVGTHYDAATIDGSDGARWIADNGGRVLAYAIAARGGIYAVSRGMRGAIDPAKELSADALMNSIHILSDAELAAAKTSLATPTPAPPRAAEDVADVLARGFAQKDTALLATVASACLTQAYEQAGPSFAASSKMLADLSRQFASGLVVTAQARPLLDQRAAYAAIASTWTGGGQPQRTAKLMLVAVGTTWYWDGWIFAQPAR